ncbi:phage tail tape measure protein [Delftia tsuruhatensis]|uniref:phage tail tape measure protein n=1 Tax=Delftia tsuruhatensis TaxID=180282 RepID=UPI0008ED9A68|nr:phage tail tape measure protein [Delftia tsuruhatensis]SFB50950.1 phage tail tape measure protein, lambda family [Delftia tsuruhatensis]
MAAESIGTARVDIVVNTDDLQTGIEAAKRQMRGFEGASDAVKQELGRMTEAQRRAAEQMLRQINTLQLGKEGLAAFRIETRTTGEVQKFLREQLAATSAAAQASGNQFAMSQKQINAAMRGVPAQITDIVVSLQGGQAPLTVLLQQGGQLRDMFGGIGPAVKALGSAVLGLVNPFTVAAAAVVGFGFAMSKAESSLRTEMSWQAFADATGRGVELSTQAMKKLRSEMALLPGVSKSMASAVVGDLAVMRDLSTASINGIGLAAADVAVIMRSTVPEAAKELGKALSDPEKGVVELNSVLRVFSAEQVASIQAMAEMGNKAGAQAAMLDVLHKATSGLALQGLTPLQKATNDFGNSWDAAMTAMGNGGPLQTANELMAGLVQRTAEAVDWLQKLRPPPWLEAQFRGGLNGMVYNAITGGIKAPANTGGATGSWGDNKGGATGSWGAPVVNAEAEAWNRQIETLRKATDGYKATSKVMADLKDHAKDLGAALQTLRSKGEGGGELAKRLQANLDGVNERLANMGKKGASGAARIAKADLSADITDIQIRYRQLTTAQGNAERMLDAQRAAGLVSERDYYAQKRQFLEDNAALQIRELEEENQRYTKQSATGADKINNDKKIAQNVGKIAEIRAKAATDVAISTLQEEAANRQLEASYKALTQSMEDYLQSSRDRYQRELDGMGLGNQWRDRNTAQNQINDRYQGQRNDLRNNRELLEMAGKWNAELEQQYARRLQIINDANQKALELDADFWRRRREQQSDWFVGANEAIANYLDEVGNVAKRTEGIVGNALSGFTSAATDALYAGNLDSFESLGETIANQITAGIISQQISAPLAQWLNGQLGESTSWLSQIFGSLMGGKGGGGGGGGGIGSLFSFLFNAKGGVYDSPSLSRYSNQVHSSPKLFAFAKGAGVFGEAGPEAIMPLTRNSAGVLGVRAVSEPGAGAGGGRGGDRIYNINVPVEGRVDRRTRSQIAGDVALQMRSAERMR